MSTYLAPGVYVEEPPPKARPIAGVGTSTAGFIGVVPDTLTFPAPVGTVTVAPAGAAQLISSWEEFKAKFGDFHANNQTLAHAVYGFFNNGGNNCFVIRVTDMTDLTASLATFEAIDEIAIVAAPGASTKLQQDALANHCAKLTDRVCVLDGLRTPATLTFDGVRGTTSENAFAAMYFPWIQVFDPASKTTVTIPPSGHVAGIYARTDATRGVFKAPANEPVLGALDVEKRITRAQQELLNPKGINVIRNFSGDIKVYGARTLGGDDNGDMRYISTRRYMSFLRESIDEGTQFVVFEPNSPALWQRIIRSVSDFLYNQWREGALFGETEKKAFFVKCDEELNPPSVREAGQVITEIGVAIVKPAEFVIFRIEQITGS